MGIKIKIKKNKSRFRPKSSEVLRLLACNKKAKKILKWSPQNSGLKGLERGLSKTINWFKNKKNLRDYKTSKFNY